MSDFYDTLGVQKTATADEIKKAYRKLASRHHPDKGGDTAVFQNIQTAYATLSDNQKRAEYNMMQQGGHPRHGPFDGNWGMAHDINGFAHYHQSRRNRDLNLRCQISLYDSFTGKELEASFNMPSGKRQSIIINVPPGIGQMETIRYHGLGDDSIQGMPRGNLNVTIIVQPDPTFHRQGDDLYTKVDIDAIEAMIGCTKNVKLVSGETTILDIRPGVSTGTEFAMAGKGFPNLHNNSHRGRFIVVVNVEPIAVTDPKIVEQLKEINATISQKSE